MAKTSRPKPSRNKPSRKNRGGKAAPAETATEPTRPAKQAATFSLAHVALLAVGAGALFLVIASGLSWLRTSHPSSPPGGAAQTNFVGSRICSGCHRAEATLWQTSQHRHAMDHATNQSVRGDFNDATYEYAGTRSRFFRKDEKFLVETDGPDGKLATFEVKYTFGVDPLQQYLIEFADGRIQALSIAWDTRPKDQGGQRWFHLYPNDAITHDDPLHWTKLNQNWNFMCAECHSTGVHKNYDAARNRFATSFSEISVGCEACHGAGSRHVEWAKSGNKTGDPTMGLVVRFDERAGISWSDDPATSMPRRSAPPPSPLRKEVETCGLCHSRRALLSEDWKPGQWLSETHRISLLDRQRSEADGQMRDDEETYNYVPFKLSKMFAKGVTCSDCHDPHAATLKAPLDAVCTQCHAPTRYETVAHRHHAEVTPSLTCASCHMPVRSYMVVDRRHDHGFRIPRPDQSIELDTPNACNDCHHDKTPAWAAEKIVEWFGSRRGGYQTFAGAFRAAWTEQPNSRALLTAVASAPDSPAVARASALAALPVPDIALARRNLADADPMVRIAALASLETLPAEQQWQLAATALSDPVRGVRIRAAELLAGLPRANQPPTDSEKLARATEEFIAAQRLNADRPEAHTTLGNLYARQGKAQDAETQFRAAIRLDPSFSPAAINLSDLFRQLGRDGEGEIVLRESLSHSEQDAALHYALGLSLVRQKRSDAALEELHRAAMLGPSQARYAYVYAVALHSAGRGDDALAVVKATLQRHPDDRDTLSAALAFSREAKDFVGALGYAERLSQLDPGQTGLSQLIDQLRRQATTSNPAR